MKVFYTPNIKGITYSLSAEESKHCVKVLRLAAGDEVCMIDGLGGLYYGIVDDPHPKETVIRIIEKIEQYGRKDYSIHMVVAPTKSMDRYEWFLEKATEIGVDEITPLISKRSERKVVKKERLEKIILSAMKQSVRAYLPKLNEPITFKDFIKKNPEGKGLIAHCENTPKPALKSQLDDNNSFTLLIGPEGDFTPEEIELAIEKGYQPVHLGKSRLRTETAAIVACHTINLLKDD